MDPTLTIISAIKPLGAAWSVVYMLKHKDCIRICGAVVMPYGSNTNGSPNVYYNSIIDSCRLDEEQHINKQKDLPASITAPCPLVDTSLEVRADALNNILSRH